MSCHHPQHQMVRCCKVVQIPLNNGNEFVCMDKDITADAGNMD